MSVKIEILDYVPQSILLSQQMIGNNSFSSSTDWEVGNNWAIAGGDATHSTGSAGNLRYTNVTFFQGSSYRIIYKISGATAGSWLALSNHLDGSDPAGSGANNQNLQLSVADGEHSYIWSQGQNNLDRLNLYAGVGFDGSLEYVNVYPLTDIDWDKSIVGELDITDHSDFPLALTFQISEIKDITSTTGDYSKSFKIPATKNNNKIFKHLYTPNIDHTNTATENKPCRILVNNLYSLVGSLKVTGVGGYGETPSYYNCVFYGNNLGWGNDLDGKYMNEINWGTTGEGLTYNKSSIETTWQDENCDSSTSPIVYPITAYGGYNPDGEPNMIQLLDTKYDVDGLSSAQLGYYGFDNGGDDYGTPPPVADWRPAVFVKDTLEKIFAQSGTNGYSINSTFVDTDMFKKLVWLLPNFKYNNPDEKYDAYAVESKFENDVSMSQDVLYDNVATTVTEDGIFKASYAAVEKLDLNQFFSGTGRLLLEDWDNTLTVTLDNGSYVDTINDYITIGEYGYYDIKLTGLEARLANGQKNPAASNPTYSRTLDKITICINIEVQTVGQTSWNILDRIDQEHHPLRPTAAGGQTPSSNSEYSVYSDWSSLGNTPINRYLNKGDKIRLTTGVRVDTTSNQGEPWILDVFLRSSNSSHFNIEFNPERVEYGQTYDLSDVINDEYKQVDFIKGITHAFNLKMTTDEGTKTVNIEPANTFYETYASAVDWTYKLDRSKETQDKFLKSDLKRNFVFKYKTDDKDLKVKYRGITYFKDIEDEYPYRERLPSNFEKGDSIFENPFFAGTYNAKDRRTTGETYIDTPFSACLWEANSASGDTPRAEKGYEFEPRLLYWNKYSPTLSAAQNLLTPKKAFAQTWVSQTLEIKATSVSTTEATTVYPQATSINRDDSSSPILSYGNVLGRDYDDATGTYTAYTTGKGLYETYYRDMFEMFKQNPRLRTAYVDLKINDIINLDFRKLIYMDGCYWRLNKINDYMPNKNKSTKVELLEWLELGTFAAVAPSFGSSYTGGIDSWTGEPILDESNNNMGL